MSVVEKNLKNCTKEMLPESQNKVSQDTVLYYNMFYTVNANSEQFPNIIGSS